MLYFEFVVKTVLCNTKMILWNVKRYKCNAVRKSIYVRQIWSETSTAIVCVYHSRTKCGRSYCIRL